MTNKRKKLARALSARTGVSHQAAINALGAGTLSVWRGSMEYAGPRGAVDVEADYREMLACYFWDEARDLHEDYPRDCLADALGSDGCKTVDRLIYHPISEQVANQYVEKLERANGRTYGELLEEAVRLAGGSSHGARIGFTSYLGHQMLGDLRLDEDEAPFPLLLPTLRIPRITEPDLDLLRAAARAFCHSKSIRTGVA